MLNSRPGKYYNIASCRVYLFFVLEFGPFAKIIFTSSLNFSSISYSVTPIPFFFWNIPSCSSYICLLSACEVFLSNIARCVVTHCDARTVCIFAVWDYHSAPNTSSRLFVQTAVCMYVCCVVVMGVWYCTVEGYNLVVNKSWKNQWPVEFRARCSPTASKPTSCS